MHQTFLREHRNRSVAGESIRHNGDDDDIDVDVRRLVDGVL